MIDKTTEKKFFLRSGLTATLGLSSLLVSDLLVAETRGFVINYIQVATHRDERNCPAGGNGNKKELIERALKLRGIDQAKISELLSKQGVDEDASQALEDLTRQRGSLAGKPANIYQYPASVPYLRLETVAGPYAYGFDLDGRGADSPTAFEDPETGQKGVDNQLFRAVGCYSVYQVSYPERPWWEEATGGDYQVETQLPAWVFSLTTEGDMADGQATVSFYRAVGHVRLDKQGRALQNLTYVVDSDPRNHGEFHGAIRNGVFTSTPNGASLNMLGGFPNYLKLSLSDAQLRLDLNPEASATGYLGGYQPWMDYWFYVGLVGDGYVDVAETYHALKRLADASPDPESGENTAISSTYRIDAVPAFLVHQNGAFITSP